MVDSNRPSASYADVLSSPGHVTAEMIGGELFLSPRPGMPHTHAMTELFAQLTLALRGQRDPDGWYFLIEPELHLGEDVVVPDLAAWRRSRMPDLTGNFTTVPPAWICEGLSRSTAKLDRLLKLPLYAKYGVDFVWLLDAIKWSLEIHGLGSGRHELVQMFEDGDVVRAQPFESVELRLDEIASLPTRASERPIIYGQAALDLVRGASPAR